MFENIEKEKNYVKLFTDTLEIFGGESRGKKKYVLRKNINTNPFPDKGAYFGCIGDSEEAAGAYSDLSIVIFPSNEVNDSDDRWIIGLVVGSLGFKNDYDLVSLPGTRRLFINSIDNKSFVKDSFMDVETGDGFSSFCDKNYIPETLENAVKSYSKVLLACSIFNPNENDNAKNIVEIFLAIYALLRRWPTNKTQKKKVEDVINKNIAVYDEAKETAEIEALLNERKYIVLQGAPGTGKTRMAKKIVAHASQDNVFFTQFHAETVYSDFIYGIMPSIGSNSLNYIAREGILVKAIRRAQETDEKVYLIIDEINRANLSNVLGTAFYLFEPMMNGDVKVEICPGLSLNKLPDNLYVIATMNTADRSLSVVDFALRRRFAWYTMYPHAITADNGMKFFDEKFSSITEIFMKYATDEELNLQPGQAYFIVQEEGADETIKTRLQYEVMPLIKEYLANGMLTRAKDDFVSYFREILDVEMYQ